jgi:protein TorT
LISAAALAGSWTYPAFEQDPPGFDSQNPKQTPITYQPIEKVSKPWHICVSHPHMADSYHLSYNYGYVEEAKRLGVELTVVAAGGYDKLPQQISQIENCVAQGANAVIISAISFTGLDGLVQELDGQGVPVIDLGNGIQSKLVKAHSLGSYEAIGRAVGEYLVKMHPKGSKPVKILWLPGPPGAGWSESANKGFQAAVADGAIQILATKYGNSNEPEQLKLVEDGLQTFPEIDYIVGVAPAAEAAVGALKEAGRQGTKIIAYYQSPEVAKLVKDGSVYAMASDSAVIQARVAFDQAIRVLEHQDYIKHVTPVTVIVDQSNAKTFDRNASLAPEGWSAVFNYKPQ